MPLSPEAQRAALASQSALVILQTLTFEHPQIDTLRLVSDKQNLNSVEGVYNRFDFEVVPPGKSTEGPPHLEITIGIIDYRVMLALRALRGISGLTITYAEVEAADPSKTIYGPARFAFESLRTLDNTQAKIIASFMPGALSDAYPARRISPSSARA